MSGLPRIIYRPLPGISPEQARDARARAWVYVFECFHRRNRVEGSAAPDDAPIAKSQGGSESCGAST